MPGRFAARPETLSCKVSTCAWDVKFRHGECGDIARPVRGSALDVAGFARWIANFGIPVSFPPMAASPGLTIG